MAWQDNIHDPGQDTRQQTEQAAQREIFETTTQLPPGLLKRLRAKNLLSPPTGQEEPAQEQAGIDTESQGLSHHDWSTRAATIGILARRGEQAPLDLIAAALQDEHEEVRAAAARALGRLHKRAPLGHLILALHDTNWMVRAAAAQALGKLGRRVPPGPLLHALRDEDDAVRAAAAGTLGAIGDPAAIEPLLQVLQDPSWHVREMAVLAAGSFGTQVPALELLVAWQDREALVREAVESLRETQPELFRAILAAKHALLLEEHADLARAAQGQNRNASDQMHQRDTLSDHQGAGSSRRSARQTLRQVLSYGWCIILGYLGGSAWYLFGSSSSSRVSSPLTIRSILTLTDLPLNATIPLWAREALPWCFLLLLAASLWALGDNWLERRRRRSHRRRYGRSRAADEDLERLNGEADDAYQVSPAAPVSRRVILTGLASVAVAGNGIAWYTLLKKNQVAQGEAITEAGSPLHTYPVTGTALALAWSPDSTRIASGGSDATVQIRDAATGQLLRIYSGHTHLILSISWSPDGRYLASGDSEASIKVWETSTGSLLTTYRGHRSSVLDLAWSPNNTCIVSGGEDGTVRIWEALSGRSIMTYPGQHGEMVNVAWSPDGTRIAALGQRQQLWIRAAATGKLLHSQPVSATMDNLYNAIGHSIGWSPDSKHIAYSNRNGNVQVLNATTGRVITTYHAPLPGPYSQAKQPYSTAGSITWSPDGAHIATTNRDKTVQVWQVATGRPLFTCQSNATYLFSVAWSPDGRYLAATCWDTPALLVWQAA